MKRKNRIAFLAAGLAILFAAIFALSGCGEDESTKTSVVGEGFEIIGSIKHTHFFFPGGATYNLSFKLYNKGAERTADFAFAFYEGERLIFRAVVTEIAPSGENTIFLKHTEQTEKGKEIAADRIILETVTAAVPA